MSLVKWKTDFDPFGLRREIDRVFGEFFAPVEGTTATLTPPMDISETKDAIIVKAELPGVEQKDIHVTLQDGVLTIKGEKVQEKEEKDVNYHKVERHYGSFLRTIALPSSIDQNKVKAGFKNGVLSITIGKKEESKPKTIHVEVK